MAAAGGASSGMAQRISPAGEVSRQERTATFATDYPRPLESVTYTLIHEYGVLVTFEEAPLEHTSDIVDPNKGNSNEGKTYLPRGGKLQFSFDLAEDLRSISDPARAILSAIDAYQKAGLSGEYQLQQAEEYFHIVPLARKNTQGVVTPVTSPLDAIVTIEGDAAHPHLVLRELATAITHASGYHVYIGHSPFLRGNELPVSRDFKAVSARAALRELLLRTGKRSSWYLMFDIRQRAYYLSIQ